MPAIAAVTFVLLLFSIVAVGAKADAAEDCPTSQTQESAQHITDFLNAGRDDYMLGATAGAVLRARAELYVTSRYLQHHPGVEDGREAFVKFHVKWYHDHPPQKSAHTALAGMVAHCALVAIMHRRPMPDPQQAGATYDSFGFDMWRLVGGRADEHWDSYLEYFRQGVVQDHEPEGNVVNAKAVPALDARTDLSCDASQVARNRRLIMTLGQSGEAHAALTAFAAQSVAPDFVEHNPLLVDGSYQGRDGYVHALESAGQALPGVTQRYGSPDFVIADCSRVVTAKLLKRRESAPPHAVYQWVLFDSWRIHGNRLAEHWDATFKGVDYRWAEVDSLNPHRQSH